MREGDTKEALQVSRMKEPSIPPKGLPDKGLQLVLGPKSHGMPRPLSIVPYGNVPVGHSCTVLVILVLSP